MSPFAFLDLLQSGKTLVADGATGTNLLARGLPRGTSSEAWLFERPQEIVRLHQDFIAAGADILLTCTFGASPLRLKETGMAEKAHQVNTRAVELARQAIGDSAVLLAASIGPCGGLLKPLGPLEESQVYASYLEQIQALDQAEVDILVIETQFDLKEASLALQAAQETSKLPKVVSFSYDRGTRTMMGVKPAQMAERFAAQGADVLGINCGKSLEENFQALQELRAATNLPIWFKPNAGKPELDAQQNTVYRLAPEEMGSQAEKWLAAGARIVGGCCGTTPAHLAEIVRRVKGGNFTPFL